MGQLKPRIPRGISAYFDNLIPKYSLEYTSANVNIDGDLAGKQLLSDGKYVSLNAFLAANNPLHIVEASKFRTLYQKCSEDISNIGYLFGQNNTSLTSGDWQSLDVLSYNMEHTFFNNNIADCNLEIWEVMCKRDSTYSPLDCWTQDLLAASLNYTTTGLQAQQIAPATEIVPLVYDPNRRPRSADVSFHQTWNVLKKTKYILSAGQIVTHKNYFKPFSINHKDLFSGNDTDPNGTPPVYQRNVTRMYMIFSQGQIGWRVHSDGAPDGPGSVITAGSNLSMRSKFHITVRAGFKGRKAVRSQVNWDWSLPQTEIFPTAVMDRIRVRHHDVSGTQGNTRLDS